MKRQQTATTQKCNSASVGRKITLLCSEKGCRRGFGRSEQSVIGGVGQGLGDAPRVEFLENLAAIVFHGVRTTAETVGDVLNGVPLSGEDEHLLLLWAQGDVFCLLPTMGCE